MLGPGDKFAGYTVVRFVGTGTLGDLYVARHSNLPRQDVIEILSADATADPATRHKFSEELTAADVIPRPDANGGEFEGRLWIAREYGGNAEVAPAVNISDRSTSPTQNTHPGRRVALVTVVSLTAIGVAVAVALGFNRDRLPNDGGPRLDGTYRAVYDDAKQTFNGALRPLPPSSKPDVGITAFRSMCTPSGCVATGTKLDTNNPNTELNRWQARRHPQRPSVATVWRFVDGHWQLSPPYRFRTDESRCLSPDGRVVPGSDIAVSVKSLEPLVDGTFRGVETTTILTNECGAEGQVFQVPYIATRIGDVPAGVAVTDPAAVPTPSTPGVAGAPTVSAALSGTYRLEFTNAYPNGGENREEQSQEAVQPEVHVWAVQSACTAVQCVATTATLSDDNDAEPTGGASVLRFANGRWQTTPTLLPPQPCGTGIGEDSQTISFSLEPQSDGSLRGTATRTVLTNECGAQGRASTTQIMATRTGDVPSSVVLADPALFQ